MSAPADRFFRSRWVEPPDGVEELDPAGSRPAFAPPACACGLKGGGETDVGIVVCDADEVASALLLTRNAAAAAPVRVCRDGVRRAVGSAPRSSTPATPTPPPASRATATRSRCATRPPPRSGSSPRSVAVAETGVIGVPLPIDDVARRDRRSRRGALDERGGARFAEAIMTTDRWPEALHACAPAA